MSRPRGWAAWNPHPKTRAKLDQVSEILSTNAEYLPLSLRQVFYLGVSAYEWPKTENEYSSLLDMMNRARRAGLIQFDAIRDDGITQKRAIVYDDADQLLRIFRSSVANFRLDPMIDQPRDAVVWTEGKGLVPMVQGFVDTYALEVISSGGFDSLTIKKQMADRFSGKPGIVLHLGDYDASGEVMFRALEQDVQAFGGDVEFHRLAVLPEQIEEWNLPTKPAKTKGNTHAAQFTGTETVELEAIPPERLRRLLDGAIRNVLDMAAFNRTQRDTIAERQRLIEWLEAAA